MAENDQIDSSNGMSLDDLAKGSAEYQSSRVQSLASRLAMGDDSAMDEAKQQDGIRLIAGAKDIAVPFVSGIVSGAGSLAHLAATGLNATGLSSDKDPSSMASRLDAAGVSANKISEDMASDTSVSKQVRDQANDMQVKEMEDSGHPLQAALQMGKYKAFHPLETASELGGAIAPVLALGLATDGLGPAAQMASRIAAFAGTSAGNDAYSAYDKIKKADPAKLAALNSDFAANPTVDAQDRLARAAGLREGMVSAGLNGIMTEMGPLGKFVKGTMPEAAEGILKAGLGSISAGGITDAAKIAAANPWGFASKKVGADTALFAGQAAGTQVSHNITDMQIDPNAHLGSGLAAAVGGAIPAAIGLGLHGARGERSNANANKELADKNVSSVQDIMAKQNLGVEDAVKVHLDNVDTQAAKDGTAHLTEGQKQDFMEYAAGKADPEAVQSAKDGHVQSVLDSAKKLVEEGKADKVDQAIDQLKEDPASGLHESVFDTAKQRSDSVQKGIDEAVKAKEEAKEAAKDPTQSALEKIDPSLKSSLESALKDENSPKPLTKEDLEQQAIVDKEDATQKKQQYDEKAAQDKSDKAKQLTESKAQETDAKRAHDLEKIDRSSKGKVDVETVKARLKSDAQLQKDAAKAELKEQEKQSKIDVASATNALAKGRIDHAFKVKKEAHDLKITEIDKKLSFDTKRAERRSNLDQARQRSAEEKTKQAEEGTKQAVESTKQEQEKTKREEIKLNALSMKARLSGAIKEMLKSAGHSEEGKSTQQEQVRARIEKSNPEGYNSALELARKSYASLKDKGNDMLAMKYDTKRGYGDIKSHLHDELIGIFPEKADRHGAHLAIARELAKLMSNDPDHIFTKEVQPPSSAPSVKVVPGSVKVADRTKEPAKFRTNDTPDNSVHVAGNAFASTEKTKEFALRGIAALARVPFVKLAGFVKFSNNLGEAFAHDPEKLQRMKDQLGDKTPSGFYDEETKTIHLFSDGLKNSEHLLATVIHEATHRGLDKLMSDGDRAEWRRTAQQMLNGNSYMRKLSDELVSQGRLRENDSPETKLHETAAYMAESLDRVKTEMANGVFKKVINAMRSIVNNILSRVAGKDYADKHMPFMSDANVLDMVRKMTNKGFEKIENWVGDRATVMEGDTPVTNFLFRSGDLEEQAGFIRKAQDWSNSMADNRGDKLDGVVWHIAKMITDGVRGLQGFREPGAQGESLGRFGRAIEPVINFSTKAAQDTTGHRQELLKLMQTRDRFGGVLKNDIVGKMGLFNQLTGVYGGWKDILGKNGEIAKAGKQMLETQMPKIDKFIGGELRVMDKNGEHAKLTSADVESLFKKNAEKYGLKSDEDLKAVQASYSHYRDAATSSRDAEAKAFIHRQMQEMLDSSSGATADKMKALSLDPMEFRNKPLSDVKNAFDKSLEIFKGDSSSRATSAKVESFKRTVEKEMENARKVRESGFLPTYRSGDYVVRATRVTKNADGSEKVEVLHRNQTDSKGDMLRELEDVKKRFASDSDVKVENGTVGEFSKIKSKVDDQFISDMQKINDDSQRTAKQKADAIQELTDRRAIDMNRIHSEDQAAEDHSRTVITGADSNVQRAMLQYNNRASQKTATHAYAADLNRWMKKVSGPEFKLMGKIREDGRKVIEKASQEDNSTVQSIKGLMYFNYLGGSVASAAGQLVHKFILAGPVASSYDPSGGSFFKSQGAQVRATYLVGRGIDKLPDGVRQVIEKAIDNGWIPHPAYVNDAAMIADSMSSKSKVLGGGLRILGSLMASVEANQRIGNWVALHDMYSKYIDPKTGAFNLPLHEGSYWQGKFLKKGDESIGAKPWKTFEEFAHHATNEAFFDMNKYNKSDIEKSPIGSMVMQFKMFAFHILQSGSRLPMRQKLEALGMMAAMSGVNNLPFMSNIDDLIDAAGDWTGHNIDTKRARTEAINSILGHDMGDLVSNGALRMFGVDVGQRTGLGDVIPATAALRPSNPHAGEEMMNSMGASFSYLNSLVKAYQSVSEGEYRKATLQVAPTAISNVFKAQEMANTGFQKDQSGMNVRKVGIGEAVARGLGFNSATSAGISEEKHFISQSKEEATYTGGILTKEYARAVMNGDEGARAAALQKINQYNDAAMQNGFHDVRINPMSIGKTTHDMMMGTNPNMEEIDRKLRSEKDPYARAQLMNIKNTYYGLGGK